jgi:hypothetical protein
VISSGAVQGHWRRNWLRAPTVDPVRDDRTTRVHWLQAGQWCGDIRVPLDRPGRDVACLADMAPTDLANLLEAEGFAGRITLDGDVCTWARYWNWRGFPCAVDAGRLWFDEKGLLIEDGVHADYREEWAHIPGPDWTAQEVQADGMDGMLLTNDSGFLLALGQRDAPVWPDLAAALTAGIAAAGDAAPAFASIYVMGHWEGANGIADLSTQPFCEGRPVLAREGGTLTLPDFHGRTLTQSLSLSPLPVD